MTGLKIAKLVGVGVLGLGTTVVAKACTDELIEECAPVIKGYLNKMVNSEPEKKSNETEVTVEEA